jgi:serine/threonine protein kinase
MSPEQAKGKAVDRRTDVWSLGAVLFEMLSGKPAFEERARFEDTLRAIVDTPAPRLADVAPHVPRAIADVVAKALERDVDARISDCELFAKMLTEALSREDAPAADAPPIVAGDALANASTAVERAAPSDDGPPEASVEASSPPAVRRRRWLRAFVLAFLALVTLGVGGVWMWRAGRLGAFSETDTTPAPSASPSASPSMPASTPPPKPPPKPAKPKPKPSASTPAKSLTASPPPPPSL